MNGVEYNYPLSSCSCYDCGKEKQDFNDTGNPSNMSVRNCEVPKSLQCQTTQFLKETDYPRKPETGYTYLNPSSMTSKYARDFYPVKVGENKQAIKGGASVQYFTYDPRLYYVPFAQRNTLDNPPISANVKLHEVATDKGLNNYGQKYNGYEDVKAGQIGYYVDKSIQDPYFSPNFSTPAKVYHTLYQDPMSNIKPRYDRVSTRNCEHLDTTKKNYQGCLSFLQDSMDHREDIMSKQMAKRNQQEYTPRWFS